MAEPSGESFSLLGFFGFNNSDFTLAALLGVLILFIAFAMFRGWLLTSRTVDQLLKDKNERITEVRTSAAEQTAKSERDSATRETFWKAAYETAEAERVLLGAAIERMAEAQEATTEAVQAMQHVNESFHQSVQTARRLQLGAGGGEGE